MVAYCKYKKNNKKTINLSQISFREIKYRDNHICNEIFNHIRQFINIIRQFIEAHI